MEENLSKVLGIAGTGVILFLMICVSAVAYEFTRWVMMEFRK